MPLIEYRCSQCSHIFERLVARSEGADESDCPDCGQHTGKRLVSLIAAVRSENGGATPPNAGACCTAGACACRR